MDHWCAASRVFLSHIVQHTRARLVPNWRRCMGINISALPLLLAAYAYLHLWFLVFKTCLHVAIQTGFSQSVIDLYRLAVYGCTIHLLFPSWRIQLHIHCKVKLIFCFGLYTQTCSKDKLNPGYTWEHQQYATYLLCILSLQFKEIGFWGLQCIVEYAGVCLTVDFAKK